MGEFFPDVGNPPDYPLTLDDIFEVQDTANDDNLIPPFEDAEIAQAAEWNQAISNLVAVVEDLRDSVIAGGLNPDAGDKLNDVITALSAGGGAPIIQDEGTPLAGAPHTTLDFAGAGVNATDAGGSKALITIPGGGGGGAALDYAHPAVRSISAAHAINTSFENHTMTLVPGSLYFTPIFIPRSALYSHLQTSVMGPIDLGSHLPMPSGAKARAGVYETNANGFPGDLLFDAGELSFTTSSLAQDATWTFSSQQTFPAGTVWLAIIGNLQFTTVQGTLLRHYCVGVTSVFEPFDWGLKATGVTFGALPDPAPATDVGSWANLLLRRGSP